MKNITHNINITRTINAGGTFRCQFCGYINKNFWDGYGHALAHTIGFLGKL